LMREHPQQCSVIYLRSGLTDIENGRSAFIGGTDISAGFRRNALRLLDRCFTKQAVLDQSILFLRPQQAAEWLNDRFNIGFACGDFPEELGEAGYREALAQGLTVSAADRFAIVAGIRGFAGDSAGEYETGNDGLGLLALAGGWSHPEPGHVWSDGPQAGLLLPLDRAQPGTRYRVRLRGSLPPGPAEIGIDIDGRRAMAIARSAASPHVLDIELSALPVGGTAQPAIRIDLSFRHRFVPFETGASIDRRALGLALVAITVTPEPLQASAALQRYLTAAAERGTALFRLVRIADSAEPSGNKQRASPAKNGSVPFLASGYAHDSLR